MPAYQVSKLTQPSYRPELLFSFDIRVVLCTSVIVSNANLTKLEAYTLVYKLEAVCCCLQTCKCGFDIRVAVYQVS